MWLVRATFAVVRRPWLIPTAMTQIWRLRRRHWWRRPPFLPVPHEPYLRFRLITAYGDPAASPRPEDVVTYLEWCRAWPNYVRAGTD